ncbi:MAG TPA: sigma-70 family RNA polymerase sigma factor, partial [Steroidobacteraceae bacterium]|nr:sigma-70 family RNA polymerase sigma factor [Steroidobacteraceae bacterium]
AQDTFLRAYEHFDTLRGNPAAGAWLRTVATRLALNQLTRHRRRWQFFSEMLPPGGDESEDSALDALSATDDLQGSLESEELCRRVHQALNSLPPHQRIPLVLFHYEEISYEEIAAQLGVSLSKVKTDILRGRLALARRLAEPDCAPATASPAATPAVARRT